MKLRGGVRDRLSRRYAQMSPSPLELFFVSLAELNRCISLINWLKFWALRSGDDDCFMCMCVSLSFLRPLPPPPTYTCHRVERKERARLKTVKFNAKPGMIDAKGVRKDELCLHSLVAMCFWGLSHLTEKMKGLNCCIATIFYASWCCITWNVLKTETNSFCCMMVLDRKCCDCSLI